MTVKAVNSMLTWATIACCAIAVVAVSAGLLMPLESERDGEGTFAEAAGHSSHLPTTAPSTESADAIWTRVLRGQMNDNVAANLTAAPSTAAAGPQSMSLVGTIGDALALIRLPDGSVVARGVGDEVGAASVLSIDAKGVELSINGQHVLLSKPQPATSTGTVPERSS